MCSSCKFIFVYEQIVCWLLFSKQFGAVLTYYEFCHLGIIRRVVADCKLKLNNVSSAVAD